MGLGRGLGRGRRGFGGIGGIKSFEGLDGGSVRGKI